MTKVRYGCVTRITAGRQGRDTTRVWRNWFLVNGCGKVSLRDVFFGRKHLGKRVRFVVQVYNHETQKWEDFKDGSGR